MNTITVARSILLLLLCAAVVHAEEITISTKSFIAEIDPDDAGNFYDPNQKTIAFAIRAGLGGWESPTEPSVEPGNFRLFSSVTYGVTCAADGTATATRKSKFIQGGKEVGVLGTTIEWKVEPPASATGKQALVSFEVQGRPNSLAEIVMLAGGKRACKDIWHRVNVTFSCHGGKPSGTSEVTGSGFPSHKTWIGGTCQSYVRQGAFKTLWACDATQTRIPPGVTIPASCR